MTASKTHVEAIGKEGQPIVIIDGFAPHPDRLVAASRTLDFAPYGTFYPGVRAPVQQGYFEGLDIVLPPILRNVFGATEHVAFRRALYSLVTTPPHALSLAQRIPHIDDVEEGMIAILHYLGHEDLGGTSFYRHRSTGFETINAMRHRRYLDALRDDFARLGEPAAAYIDGDTPIFERIATVRPRYNRAVIYRSSLLHCASLPNDVTLSADIDSGRLTVASFLIAR
ncbi:DUF6445 family protein [Hephaestia sp. GCM10023244]|uniref:DUF6445 family protein n=1 Tax=unclassified Hephaestia TaxID=2631281 RepID=UPI0020777162|nr:DUF6445 family protein [Hephaestia sp. MAHUQ-44]MCM8731006.1 DUF6445 family protein [Hephaestia sp. MAHUQ-44]